MFVQRWALANALEARNWMALTRQPIARTKRNDCRGLFAVPGGTGSGVLLPALLPRISKSF